MPLVDAAVYVEGRRVSGGSIVGGGDGCAGQRRHGLDRAVPPERGGDASLAILLELHPLAVEDTLKGHQRAKLERYGDKTFLVLQPARYLDDIGDGRVR